jgi:NDP-sugar pyrophosphorylase family protein
MLPVAILAGGLATRLRPITERIPKALVDVAGHPFIAWQLRYLQMQGISGVVLCVGYRGDQIQEVIGDGAQFGLRVEYAFDGERLLGTGGALRRALPHLGSAFFVLYGDSFLPIDFTAVEDAFRARRKAALMTVLRNDNRWDKSNVEFQDGVVIEYNKHAPRPEMRHIDYGLSVISSGILASYGAGEVFDLAEVFHALSVARNLAGFEVQQRFYEIGSREGLAETEAYLQTRQDLCNTRSST